MDRVRIANATAWWTITTWAVYAASVGIVAFPFNGGKVALLGLALCGVAAGFMLLRGAKWSRTALAVAYLALLVYSADHLSLLVDKVLATEAINTADALGVLARLYVGLLNVDMLLGVAALYREVVMPALQLGALILVSAVWIKDAMPPNSTVETDARKSGARGSL
jgi:hypothetical protein